MSTSTTQAKKKRKIPWAALGWGTAAGLLAWRTFYHPSRAVVADGFVSACPGPVPEVNGCRQNVEIEQFGGAGPVYSVVDGTVIQVLEHFGPAVQGARKPDVTVKIAAAHEPVVLSYSGPMQMQVSEGSKVGVGQQIALSSTVRFGVTELSYVDGKSVEGTAIEPTSWLVARGLRISRHAHPADTAGPNWCEAGRHRVVPESVGLCAMKLPAPSGLMLMPVSVRMA